MDTSPPVTSYRAPEPLLARGLGRTATRSAVRRHVEAFVVDDDTGLYAVAHDPEGDRARTVTEGLRGFFAPGESWSHRAFNLDLASAALEEATGHAPGDAPHLGVAFVLLRRHRALLVELGPCRNYLFRGRRLRPVEPHADQRFVRALTLDVLDGDRIVLATPGMATALAANVDPAVLEGPRGVAANELLGLADRRDRHGAATVVVVTVKSNHGQPAP